MKKTASFAALFSVVIVLVFLAGCRQSGAGSANLYNYHTGSQGIEMSFIAGNPPATMYSSNPMAINVEVKNLGAYDLARSNMCVLLTGYDPSMITFAYGTNVLQNDIGVGTGEFSFSSCPYSFDSGMNQLPGKSVLSPNGGVDNVQWSSGDIKFSADEYKPIFQVTSCYRYMTEASLPVCIDPNPYLSVNQPKVCTVHDISGGSQGAPVAVSKIEEDISPARTNSLSGYADLGPTVYFRIYVNNVGAGQVLAPDSSALSMQPTILGPYYGAAYSGSSQAGYSSTLANYIPPESLEHCASGNLVFKDYDKVYIEAFLGGGTDAQSGIRLTCYPEVIPLTKNQGSALCQATLDPSYSSSTAYTSQLNILLRYGYTKSIIKQVTIKNTARLAGGNNFFS